MKKLSITILNVFFSIVLIGQRHVWEARPATYSIHEEKGLRVKMSDGVELLVDVYAPADSILKAKGERFPVLLTQNPYAFMNAAPHISYIDFYVHRGYICVVAHIRGTNGSGGKNYFLSEREQLDGPELVNWAATQLANSNGKVGLFGTSWLGFTQVTTAAKIGKNSPVKAMVPTYMGAYVYRDLTPSGIPSQSIYFPRDFDKPGMLGNDSTSATGMIIYDSWKGNGELALEGTFWNERQPINFMEQIYHSGIPTLLFGGWQDLYPTGISDFYASLQNLHSLKNKYDLMDLHQEASSNYQLVMGPWGHYKGLNVEMTLAWYDKWLKGIENANLNTAFPYHAVDMTTGIWYDFSSYPFTDKYKSFELGKELTNPSVSSSASIEYGQRSQLNTSISFRTAPFTEDIVIAGPGAVKLVASTSVSDMAFLVELMDVNEKGETKRITQGNVIASLSDIDRTRSWTIGNDLIRPYLKLDKEKVIRSEKEYVLDFPLSPRLATIGKGHHLEAIISSMPKAEDCTGNLGVFPCFPNEKQVARMSGGRFTVRLNTSVKSKILLPVVSKNSLKISDMSFDSTPNHPF